jgi:hypothetical protein
MIQMDPHAGRHPVTSPSKGQKTSKQAKRIRVQNFIVPIPFTERAVSMVQFIPWSPTPRIFRISYKTFGTMSESGAQKESQKTRRR